MAPTHGFMVKILKADGKPDTALFASTRKCPELLGIIKQIAKTQRVYDRGVQALALTRQRVNALMAGDMDGAGVDFSDKDKYAALTARVAEEQTALETKTDEVDASNAELCELIWSFYKKGFVGAGYTDDQAELLAQFCDPSEYPAMRDRSMTGCGVVDFTKRDAF